MPTGVAKVFLGMTTNEIITLVVSSAALIVATVSMYYQFLRKQTAFIGKNLQVSYVSKGDYDIEWRYLFANTGNTELVVEAVTVVRSAYEDPIHPDSSHVNYRTDCATVPAVVKPGEAKLIDLCCRRADIDEQPTFGPHVFVWFQLASAKGESYWVYHRISWPSGVAPGPEASTFSEKTKTVRRY